MLFYEAKFYQAKLNRVENGGRIFQETFSWNTVNQFPRLAIIFTVALFTERP